MRFEVIYFKTRGSDYSEIRTGFVQKLTTEYFSTIVVHPFRYVVTNNLA